MQSWRIVLIGGIMMGLMSWLLGCGQDRAEGQWGRFTAGARMTENAGHVLLEGDDDSPEARERKRVETLTRLRQIPHLQLNQIFRRLNRMAPPGEYGIGLSPASPSRVIIYHLVDGYCGNIEPAGPCAYFQVKHPAGHTPQGKLWRIETCRITPNGVEEDVLNPAEWEGCPPEVMAEMNDGGARIREALATDG